MYLITVPIRAENIILPNYENEAKIVATMECDSDKTIYTHYYSEVIKYSIAVIQLKDLGVIFYVYKKFEEDILIFAKDNTSSGIKKITIDEFVTRMESKAPNYIARVRGQGDDDCSMLQY